MAPDRFPPDDPREWLNRARGNLALARVVAPGVFLEDLCYNAQQAAEKAMKAVLLANGLDFPFTHDLARLITLLDRAGETLPASAEDAWQLTTFAVVTRYPNPDEPVTAEEYEQAVAIAEAVVVWAEGRVPTTKGDAS